MEPTHGMTDLLYKMPHWCDFACQKQQCNTYFHTFNADKTGWVSATLFCQCHHKDTDITLLLGKQSCQAYSTAHHIYMQMRTNQTSISWCSGPYKPIFAKQISGPADQGAEKGNKPFASKGLN